MNHLINSVSDGVASCRIENGCFIPTFYSDGVASLFDYTRDEFDKLIHENVLNSVYAGDRERVTNAALQAVRSGEVLTISYRIRRKNGNLTWIHLNGRRIGPLTGCSKFYASFSGGSDESKMYQEIANEAADAIYVIDRKRYELLYFHESRKMFPNTKNCIGKQCHEVLQGLKEPCSFCNCRNGCSSLPFPYKFSFSPNQNAASDL